MNRLLTAIVAAGLALFLSSAPTHSAEVTLSADKTFIVMEGQIDLGDVQKFADLYNEPDSAVTSVMLVESPGGAYDAGVFIGREIRRLGLSTATFGYCHSACAFLWAGGIVRAVHASDTMGWHTPALGIASADGKLELANSENSKYTEEEIENLNSMSAASMRVYLTEMEFPPVIIDAISAVKQPNAAYFDPVMMMVTGMANVMIDDRG